MLGHQRCLRIPPPTLIEGRSIIRTRVPWIGQSLLNSPVLPESRKRPALPESLVKVDGHGGVHLVVDVCFSGKPDA